MEEHWKRILLCLPLPTLHNTLNQKDGRVFSVFDHQPICTDCKRAEETRPDYPTGPSDDRRLHCCDRQTLQHTGGYCFHNFFPFKCKE